MEKPFTQTNTPIRFNPFPGLRPFTTQENHLFFGREGQSQEVLDLLAQNNFVALLGTSGSGKSSLMYCGVIPILEGGFITEAGVDWKTITCRPGHLPLVNLSETLLQEFALKEEEKDLKRDYIHTSLDASSMGLLEILKQIPREEDQNILLLIDQFEELFRFNQIHKNVDAFNEVLAYIQLLLEVLRQKELPVYIVITMRSDFIGECAQFQDLTRIINDSHYLIPQMTREDFREAICGPIAVGGGMISPHLVQQLLNDIGERPDQLPILQHALMRTWESWMMSGRTDAIDIRDYENVGKLEKALSEHANEAYNELSEEEKGICQSVFKTLTEKGSDNRGVRRPTAVKEIAAISSASVQEVIQVIDHFRIKGRSFVTPGEGIPLTEDSIVDISHESLMRIWDKLIVWVSEEYESVQIYKRLADSAEKFQNGEAGLWRQPDLQLAISWRDKQNPTLSWAKRHHPAFERTMVFLENSYQEYQLEEENKLRQQRRTIRRSRTFAIILGSATIISMFFMINARMLRQKAEEQTDLANREKENAVEQTQIAEEQRQKAERQQRLAQEQEELALEQKELADKERKNAEENALRALRQEKIANQKSIEASEQRKIAEQNMQEAQKQQELAEMASITAQRLRMISISQSMAVKSSQMTLDTNLKALLAYQSYTFNQRFQGEKFNGDIYNGLYLAHKFLYTQKATDYLLHAYPVRSVVFSADENTMYSTGNDGLICKWDILNTQDTNILYRINHTNRVLSLQGDQLWVGTSAGEVLQLSLNQTVKKENILYLDGMINGLCSPDSKNVLIGTSLGQLVMFNKESRSQQELQLEAGIKSMVCLKNVLYGVTTTGYMFRINDFDGGTMNYFRLNFTEDGLQSTISKVAAIPDDLQADQKINAIAINPQSGDLVVGNLEGDVMIYNSSFKQLHRLVGHTARINDIEFSENQTYLATASNDGKALLWYVPNLNLEPYVLGDNESWVMALEFIHNEQDLIATYADGKIRRWPTQDKVFAEKVKGKIKRNFSTDEWSTYVGQDISYEKTIENLP